MFTIKFYSTYGANETNYFREKILSAESFTILRRDDGSAEITLHQKDQNFDCLYDIADGPSPEGFPDRFEKAIIENAMGRTSEIVAINHMTRVA